jgi:hypothetical protein
MRLSTSVPPPAAKGTTIVMGFKGLLFAQGIRGVKVKSQYKTLAIEKFLTGDGHRLPPRLACERPVESDGAGTPYKFSLFVATVRLHSRSGAKR